MAQKTEPLSITISTVDRLSEFLHCQTEQRVDNINIPPHRQLVATLPGEIFGALSQQ